MTLPEVVAEVARTHGYPNWVARIFVELMLLEAAAAHDRLVARGWRCDVPGCPCSS